MNFNIVKMGDLNVNFLKRNELIDCLDISGLSNLVHNATCFKGAPSVIDLVITNKPKRFKSTTCADTFLGCCEALNLT